MWRRADERCSEKAWELMLRSRFAGILFVLVTSGAIPIASPRWDAAPALFAQTPAASALVDLKDASELHTRFNADRGYTRLVLLLSPT